MNRAIGTVMPIATHPTSGSNKRFWTCVGLHDAVGTGCGSTVPQ
jgi:hypothetical protein